MTARYPSSFFILFLLALALPSAALGFSVDVRCAILMDMNSTKTLYQKNADQRIAPASLTKIMTMYLAYEAVETGRAGFGDMVPISHRADATGGSSMNAVTNTRIPLIELMKGMGVVSGNDACVAVAEYLGGSVRGFVKMMNAKARELGMKSTVFKNPHGLPARGQVTTARDMALLADRYIRRFPQCLRIHRMRYYEGNGFRKRNRNRLLGTCEGVDGLKTGYVYSSKYNVITTAQRNGRRLLGVIMGAETPRVRAAQMRKLVEMGFGGPEAPAAPDAPPSTALAEAEYSLQESSFKDREQALSRSGQLRELGLETQVVAVSLEGKGVWHRVLIGGFENLKQAARFKKFLADTHGLKHVLVLKTTKLKGLAVSDPATEKKNSAGADTEQGG